MTRSTALALLLPLALPASGQALKLVASRDIADLNVSPTAEAVPVDFTGVVEPVTGFGLVADWVFVQGDSGGGTGPWSLDASIEAESPAGDSAVFTRCAAGKVPS